MQTFLPYDTYEASARVLDRSRLGKQRVECKQILRSLLGITHGWKNHPAVKMWAGYEAALCRYAIAICEEWVNRGYNDTMLPWFQEQREYLGPGGDPPFIGSARFHASHRSNLLRKNPEWYERFGWREPNDLPYVWPTKEAT